MTKVLLAMTLEEAKMFNIYNEEDNQTFAEMEADAQKMIEEVRENTIDEIIEYIECGIIVTESIACLEAYTNTLRSIVQQLKSKFQTKGEV
jgi:hypothetical protein